MQITSPNATLNLPNGNTEKEVTTEWKLFRIYFEKKTFAVRVCVQWEMCKQNHGTQQVHSNFIVDSFRHWYGFATIVTGSA